MNIIEKAIQFATKAHEGTCRKGTSLPYIIHPLEAASIAAQITEDPEVIAAAALHDVVEDTSFTEDNIRVLFGSRVAKLVASDSEDKHRDKPAAETWKLRKLDTVRHLEHASNDELIVVFSDKLSNLRAMVKDYIRQGEFFWERFTQKDPDKHIWYYSAMVPAFEKLFDSQDNKMLFGEYLRNLSTLKQRVQEYQALGYHDPDLNHLSGAEQKLLGMITDKRESDLLEITADTSFEILNLFEDIPAPSQNGSVRTELLIKNDSGHYFDVSVSRDDANRLCCTSRLLPKGSKAGYNGCWKNSITITADLIPSLDFPLRALIGYWQNTAEETTHVCPVKSSSMVFNYKDRNYTIYPGLLGLDGGSFENMMLQSGEADLVGIGAKKVFCTAMID